MSLTKDQYPIWEGQLYSEFSKQQKFNLRISKNSLSKIKKYYI